MKRRSGFTLVELSIVLVILGLLIGGVLTGQSLIRAAELRSVSTQYSRYVTATQTFRDKYFALPGDMTNATAYWGIVSGSTTGSDAACLTSASTGPATCNGNGDGQVLFNSGASNERFRFWQHLANAGLIEGSYDGIGHGSSSVGTTAANAPAGRISGTYWGANNAGTVSTNTNYPEGQYDNLFLFGGLTANNWPIGTVFKPEDVYNIDAKIDDGKPSTGKVVAYSNNYSALATSCTDASSSAVMTASYLLTNTAASCAFVFRQAF